MIDKLKEIKELRKTRKLVAEEELKRLEKDLEKLTNLANKSKQKSQAIF